MRLFYNLERSLTVSLILILMVYFLISCKKNQNKGSEGKAINSSVIATQINWIGHWRDEGDKGKLVREIANEYEFLNQNVKVNLKFPEDLYGDAGSSEINFILSELKKPTADWDIIRLYGHFPEIAKSLNDPNWTDKYLVDFSQIPGFIESHGSFINNKTYKNRFKNKYFGPYTEGQVSALFVNTEVAKKMGITVKQFDMTFEDFLGYIKAAFEYNKTHSNIIPVFEYDWRKSSTIFRTLFFSLMDNYEEIANPKFSNKKLDAIEKCYQACEQLSKYNVIEKNWLQHHWSTENEKILNDSCLFFPNFTFMYNIWKKNSSGKMNKVIPCEYPVFKTSSTYIGGYLSNFAILKNAPHKDDAIKLLMYWCKPVVAEKWVRYSKSPSGVKGNLTTSSFGFDPYESYSYMIDKKYGGNLVKDEDVEYIVGEKNTNIPLRIEDVLEGKISSKEAFNEFKRKAIF